VSKTTSHVTDYDFKAEAFGKVEYFLSIDAIMTMAELSIFVAAP
jgi:hypothetical protein